MCNEDRDGLPSEANQSGLMSEIDIARLMGVCRSRIGQIRRRALRKLRIGLLSDPTARLLIAEICGLSEEQVERLRARYCQKPARVPHASATRGPRVKHTQTASTR